MAGPKAPKDPERKRPYFYIMKDLCKIINFGEMRIDFIEISKGIV